MKLRNLLFFSFMAFMALPACKVVLPSADEAVSVARKAFRSDRLSYCKDVKFVSSRTMENSVETSWICRDDLDRRVSVFIYVDVFRSTEILKMGMDDVGPIGDTLFIDMESKQIRMGKTHPLKTSDTEHSP